MLLAYFTLHKVKNTSVVSDLDGKKILCGFHRKLAILRNLDGEIQLVEGHYFKIVSTIYSSNWNSINSGFHHATHLVWLQEWHPLKYRALWLQEIWLWPFGCIIQILCIFLFLCKFTVIVFRLERTTNGEIWHLKPFHMEFLKFQLIL
jgi:hypothetical protein